MKNKIDNNLLIFRYMFQPIIYFILSGLLATGIIYTLYVVADSLYRSSKYKILNNAVDYFMYIKGFFLGDLIYAILFILITCIIYALISYKRSQNIILLINSVKKMADGNLEQKIEIENPKKVKELANNINTIVDRLRDITIEERIAQQTKTDLITNVSHDLRTPLTSIIGYLSLIEEDKYKDEVQLRYYTNIAYEKAKTLSLLINDLFDLTKMQNNSMPMDKIQINLVELIGQIVSHFEFLFEKEKIKCRVRFSEDKFIIMADPIKLVRAFENLITNAMKYGKDGGYIDVVTSKEKSMAVVEIINYGESIPILDLPHIFDRFYRVEKSRNRNDGGSGLGLAITKNIIELHLGEISVTSDNIKTVFKVKLPIIE